MSYITYRLKCQKCKEVFNVAFGIVGMTIIAQPPTKCPECGSKRLKKVADGWKMEPIKGGE